MNQELQQQLANILQKAMNLAEKTGQFVIDQAPDLLKQFYYWHIAQAIFAIIMFILAMYLTKRFSLIFGYKDLESVPENEAKNNYKLYSNKRYYYTDYVGDSDSYTGYLIFNYGAYLWLAGVITHLYTLLYIFIAPKLYLIEYFLHK